MLERKLLRDGAPVPEGNIPEDLRRKDVMGALGAGGDEDWYRTLSLEEDYRARQVSLGFNFLKKDALLQTKGSQQPWGHPSCSWVEPDMEQKGDGESPLWEGTNPGVMEGCFSPFLDPSFWNPFSSPTNKQDCSESWEVLCET